MSSTLSWPLFLTIVMLEIKISETGPEGGRWQSQNSYYFYLPYDFYAIYIIVSGGDSFASFTHQWTSSENL